MKRFYAALLVGVSAVAVGCDRPKDAATATTKNVTPSNDAQAANELLKAALADKELIVDPQDKLWASMVIAPPQAKAGDVAGAKDTFEKEKIAAAQFAGYSDQAHAYESLAEGQLSAGDFAGAKDTADQIHIKSQKAMVYQEIAEAQAKAGDVAGAKDAFEKAKNVCEKSSFCIIWRHGKESIPQ